MLFAAHVGRRNEHLILAVAVVICYCLTVKHTLLKHEVCFSVRERGSLLEFGKDKPSSLCINFMDLSINQSVFISHSASK